MRIIYEDRIIAIKLAERVDKRLIFKDLDNVYYYTDDYYAENIAQCMLNDLLVNGYIRVKELLIKERS